MFELQKGTLLVNVVLFFGIVLISYNIHSLQTMQDKSLAVINSSLEHKIVGKGIVWIDGHGKNPLTTYMRHIVDVFQWLGYEVITGDQPDDAKWDIMWIHDYIFSDTKMNSIVKNASKRQIINHIPGTGYFTSKVSLATAELSVGMPKSFQIPEEKEGFLKFAKDNPEMLWVQKSNGHRNVKIVNAADVDMEQKGVFLQRFVDNPLLIDNRKFDIGVYVVVTSVLPLRAYLYDGDVLLRFCAKDYEPFDENDLDKYVVGDDYTPIWEIDSLRDSFVTEGLGWRDTLDVYLFERQIDPTPIWKQIREIIAQVLQRQQPKMLNVLASSGLQTSCFELTRFDFVVDDTLTVHLMEANMSPNLSSAHFKQNQLLYEQVIYNALSLLGIANRMAKSGEDATSKRTLSSPQISSRDVRLRLKSCFDDTCKKCDSSVECALCGRCLTPELEQMLRETYLEHVNSRRFIRIPFDHQIIKPLTKEDHILTIWLQYKCSDDSSWCY